MLNSTQLFEILAVLIAILAFEWLVLSLNWLKVKIPREVLEEERKRKERRKYSWTIKIEELEDSLLERLGRLLLDMGFTQYGSKFYSNDSIVIFENESEELKIIVFSSSPLKIANLAGKIEMEALKCSIKS
mgnify:CR=1 FL=1